MWTGSRLPRRPQPYPDEALTSWLMRLAFANAQRLPYLAFHLFDDRAVWSQDPDRVFNEAYRARLALATGTAGEILDRMLLTRFEGRLAERLVGSASPWLLVLSKVNYVGSRHATVYCPACLADDAEPHLSVFWRLAWMTVCPRHGTTLRDACPHCGAVFAPALNDLGPGRDWSRQSRLPFAWCWRCGRDVRVETELASEHEQAFQCRLLAALEHGTMAWPGLREVPALEGFEVLRQLLNVLFLAGPQQVVSGSVPGPERSPEGPWLMFRDFDLPGRRALLGQLAFLTEAWPHRLLDVAGQAGLTRRPMVAHLPTIPPWYDTVADQLHQGNGRRRIQRPLVNHLDLTGIGQWRDQAVSPEERRRWDILWHYAQQPNKHTVATQLGVRWALVSKVVDTYNLGGPQAMRDPRRGQVNRHRRAFSAEQEQELAALVQGDSPTVTQLAAWSEERTGCRLDPATLRRYRRRLKAAQHAMEHLDHG